VTEDPTRSAAVVVPAPGVTDDGDTEWFVPAPATSGPGSGRRQLRVGDHLDPQHPLVLAWPERFSPSAEPVDCWPISLPSLEARKRAQAEQVRLASHPARKVTPVCARCGAESERAVVMLDAPTQLDLLNALAGLDNYDPDARAEAWRIERRFAAMARAAKDQEHELARVDAAWRSQHQQCPEGTAPLPEPEAPGNLPLFYRNTRIVGVGEVSVPSIPSPNGG
jgi:hypothetical protein